MSFVACLSIPTDVSQIEQLNKTVHDLAERTIGEVMVTGSHVSEERLVVRI